jgi:hypothetical protein
MMLIGRKLDTETGIHRNSPNESAPLRIRFVRRQLSFLERLPKYSPEMDTFRRNRAAPIVPSIRETSAETWAEKRWP